MFEIADPAEFYDTPESVELPRAAAPVAPPTANNANDDVLARIVELEAKLSADRARKPKFRKPELQQQWQAELDVLYRSLD